jgi:hypothetical protein
MYSYYVWLILQVAHDDLSYFFVRFGCMCEWIPGRDVLSKQLCINMLQLSTEARKSFDNIPLPYNKTSCVFMYEHVIILDINPGSGNDLFSDLDYTFPSKPDSCLDPANHSDWSSHLAALGVSFTTDRNTHPQSQIDLLQSPDMTTRGPTLDFITIVGAGEGRGPALDFITIVGAGEGGFHHDSWGRRGWISSR